MATMDDLVTEVSQQSDVIGSVETLVGGLRTQLADAIANGASPEVLQGLVDQIDANTARLAAAVEQTPANG